jgi:hypothetical protein
MVGLSHRRWNQEVLKSDFIRSCGAHCAQRGFFCFPERGKGFNKTDFYKVFPPPENLDIFTEIWEWKHAQMKRFAVTPYSLASMQRLAPCIEDVERQLIEKLDGFAGDSRKVCDLGDWLHWFAFDVGLSRHVWREVVAHFDMPKVLGEVAFSQHSGFIERRLTLKG